MFNLNSILLHTPLALLLTHHFFTTNLPIYSLATHPNTHCSLIDTLTTHSPAFSLIYSLPTHHILTTHSRTYSLPTHRHTHYTLTSILTDIFTTHSPHSHYPLTHIHTRYAQIHPLLTHYSPAQSAILMHYLLTH